MEKESGKQFLWQYWKEAWFLIYFLLTRPLMTCSIRAISKWSVLQCEPLHCHHCKLFLRSFLHLKTLFDCMFLTGKRLSRYPHKKVKTSILQFPTSLSTWPYMSLNQFVLLFVFGLLWTYGFVSNRFLRLLIEKLCLPAYCLVDCDPYGFDILTTYRFGSMVRFIK